jgi:hypothetical protein
MRDYLYVWNEPKEQFLVASGLEFKDFLPVLSAHGGVALIDHSSEVAATDRVSGFDFVPASGIANLAAEDIYSWGNFVWADYTTLIFPEIRDEEIAELLFFAHKARPLRRPAIHGLENRFLAYAHDDGWYLKLYYSDWKFVQQLLVAAIPTSVGTLDVSELERGSSAFWLQDGKVFEEESTHDVDAVLNRRQ